MNQGDLSLNGGLPQFNINIPNNGSNGGANLLFGTSANQFLQTENQFQVVNNWTRAMKSTISNLEETFGMP